MKVPAVLFALAVLFAGPAATADNIKGNAFGNPNAPLMLEIYSDFECPGCKTFHDAHLPNLMKEYVIPGKVYLVYRYFPWPQHPHGRQAADLVAAAAQMGKYEPAAQMLFASQPVWSAKGNVEEYVDKVLTPDEQKKLKALAASPAVKAQVDKDIQLGKSVPVTSTPCLVLTKGMRRYPMSGTAVFNYPLIKSFLDDQLKK